MQEEVQELQYLSMIAIGLRDFGKQEGLYSKGKNLTSDKK